MTISEQIKKKVVVKKKKAFKKPKKTKTYKKTVKKRKSFDVNKWFNEQPESVRLEIITMNRRFRQLPRQDFIYLYKKRTEALKLCDHMLIDPARAGKDWLFFGTGAVKYNWDKCIKFISEGKTLYDFLGWYTKSKKKIKNVLTKCS